MLNFKTKVMKFFLDLLVRTSKSLIRVFLLQLIFINMSIANGSAQSIHEMKVDIVFTDNSLQEVFGILESATEFNFSYESGLIKTKKRFNKRYHQSRLSSILLDLSKAFNIRFKRINETIYVSQVKNIGFDISENTLVQEIEITKKISGKVVDEETNEPLFGVNVRVVAEELIGTTTDPDGLFELEVPDDSQHIIFSYIGYKEQKVAIADRLVLNVSLNPIINKLEDLVVVGYSTQKTADITGAISTIKTENIETLPVNGIEQALQGQIPGVQVTSSGAPGGNVSVRIRGYGTLGNNEPLYIVDGVPTKFNLNQFATGDIENIQVLKDAAATAIYGARAANGVIIINTKKGAAEGLVVNLSSQLGVQIPTNLPSMLNTQAYTDLLWQAQINSGITPSNDLFGDGNSPVIPEFIDDKRIIPASLPGTNWFDELFNPALMQQYSLSIQSGGGDVKNYTSISHLDQEGIMEYTGFGKTTFRTNTTINKSSFSFGENITLSLTNTQVVPTNQALGSRIIHAYRINPVVPVFDINGGYAGPVNGVQGALNPLGINYLDRNDRNSSKRLFGNFFVEYEAMPGLSFKTNFGVDYSDINRKDYDPAYEMGVTSRGSTSFFQMEASQFQYVWSNTLQYKQRLDHHDFSLLIGQEAIKNTYREVGGTSSDFITDDIDYIQLNNGNGQSSNFSNGTEWALLSLFTKLDYQYLEKYVFSASLRRDGSSRFGENNRFGWFPAFSLGWKVSEESFFNSSQVNALKIRLSYGKSGNQEIGNFPSFSTYSASAWDTYYAIDGSNTKATIGFKPTRIGNPDVKWETTTQLNFGIDINLNNGFFLNLDVFNKTTEDILIQRPTLAIEGQAEPPFVNLGGMRNRGVELNLGYQHTTSWGLDYSVSGNASVVRNKVTQLANDVVRLTGLVNNTFSRNLILSVTEVGQPIAQFYGHIVDGVFKNQQQVQAHADQPGKGIGRLIFRDINEDGIIDENDRTFIGSPHPDFIFGINANASYKGFDLSFLIQGVLGNELYNFTRYYTDFYYDLGNRHQRVLGAWKPSNPNSNIPMVAAVDVNNELRPSTYFIEDGSFIRLKNIQLGYSREIKEGFLKKFRIYIQAQNLLTITKYEGMDPEVGLSNIENQRRDLDIGIDRGVYPNAKIFMTGLNLTF